MDLRLLAKAVVLGVEVDLGAHDRRCVDKVAQLQSRAQSVGGGSSPPWRWLLRKDQLNSNFLSQLCVFHVGQVSTLWIPVEDKSLANLGLARGCLSRAS